MNAGIDSALIFLVINLAAGFLNYLYQVIAAKNLGTGEFSALSAWMAYVSLALLLPSAIQYAANFYPLPNRPRKALLLSFTLGAWAFLFLWLAFPASLSAGQAILIVLSACAFAWMLGELQVRLMLLTMAGVNLGLAGLKLGSAVWVGTQGQANSFALALIVGYAPLTSVLCWKLWNIEEAPQGDSHKAWKAAILLSVAGAAIPQMDMIVVHATQPAGVFEDFAHASLFYKAIYFVVFIFAQWLLPQQLRRSVKLPGEAVLVPMILLFAALSGAMAWLSPFVATQLLGWSSAPEFRTVFLSCLNICLLTVLYLHIQSACAKGRLKVAALALLALAAEALVQLSASWSLLGYFLCALVTQLILLVFVMRSTHVD